MTVDQYLSAGSVCGAKGQCMTCRDDDSDNRIARSEV